MTLPEAILAIAAGGFIVGVIVCWEMVQRYWRPRWESAVWWRTAPEQTRRTIAEHAAAAAQLDAGDQAAGAARPDDITEIIAGLPHIPAHEPPPGSFVPGMVIMTDHGRAGWLQMELAGLREWTHRLTGGASDDD